MTQKSRAVLLGGLLVVLALAAGLVLGRGTVDAVPRVTDAVDIGFARDMKVHHALTPTAHVVLRAEVEPALAGAGWEAMRLLRVGTGASVPPLHTPRGTCHEQENACSSTRTP